MYCKTCGSTIEDGRTTCGVCGTSISSQPEDGLSYGDADGILRSAGLDFSWNSSGFEVQEKESAKEESKDPIDFKWESLEEPLPFSPQVGEISAAIKKHDDDEAILKRVHEASGIFEDDTFHLRNDEDEETRFMFSKKNEEFQELLDEEFEKIQTRQKEINEDKNRVSELMAHPTPTPKTLVSGDEALKSAEERIADFLKRADIDMLNEIERQISEKKNEVETFERPLSRDLDGPWYRESEPAAYDIPEPAAENIPESEPAAYDIPEPAAKDIPKPAYENAGVSYISELPESLGNEDASEILDELFSDRSAELSNDFYGIEDSVTHVPFDVPEIAAEAPAYEAPSYETTAYDTLGIPEEEEGYASPFETFSAVSPFDETSLDIASPEAEPVVFTPAETPEEEAAEDLFLLGGFISPFDMGDISFDSSETVTEEMPIPTPELVMEPESELISEPILAPEFAIEPELVLEPELILKPDIGLEEIPSEEDNIAEGIEKEIKETFKPIEDVRLEAPDIINKPVVFPFEMDDETLPEEKRVSEAARASLLDIKESVLSAFTEDRDVEQPEGEKTPKSEAEPAGTREVETPPEIVYPLKDDGSDIVPAAVAEPISHEEDKKSGLDTAKVSEPEPEEEPDYDLTLYGKKKNHRTRVLSVLLNVMILVVVLVLAMFAIVKLAPDTGFAELLMRGWNSVFHSEQADGEDIRTVPDAAMASDQYVPPGADGDALVKSQIEGNNYNIGSIKYDAKAKYEKGQSYPIANAAESTPIENDYWIDWGDGVMLYDEQAIAALIRYDSRLITYINSGDDAVFSEVLPGSAVESETSSLKTKIEGLDITYLGIGDIRIFDKEIFIWTQEKIVEKIAGKSQERTVNKLYELTTVTNAMFLRDVKEI